MQLNINLASQPYEDVKRFLLRWGLLVTVIAVLTGGLVFYAISSWRQSKDVNRQIGVLQQEMASLDREKAAGIQLLNRPDNRKVADQSRFLNQVIARKAFSWTLIFENLERIMPPRLHIVSISPELTSSNELQMRLVVMGDSRDRAVELVRRMEESPTFRQAQLKSEQAVTATNNSGDTIQFDISSLYTPPQPATSSDKSQKPAMQEVPGEPKAKKGPSAPNAKSPSKPATMTERKGGAR